MPARKDMLVVFSALLSHLDNTKIDRSQSDLVYRPNIVLRGRRTLHITFEKRVQACIDILRFLIPRLYAAHVRQGPLGHHH